MRPLPLLACLAAFAAASALPAQIMQVGDDGALVVQNGPTITTAEDGTRAIGLGRGVNLVPHTDRTGPVPAALTLDGVIAGAARETGVDARLLHAVAWHESRYRQDVVSSKGAIGVMQIMPQTARWLGIDPRDVVQNIRGGAALLGWFLRQYGGNVELALAAYSAGPGAVQRYGGVPPFAETQNYVADIRRRLSF